MKKLFPVCVSVSLLIVAASPAPAQTLVEFVGTGGNLNFNDANNWIEIEFGFWPADAGDQITYQKTVPDANDSVYMRNGATLTMNSGTTRTGTFYVGGRDMYATGDPNRTDPNFAYLSAPGTTLSFQTGAVLLVGSASTNTTNLYIGQFYNGTLNQTGGSINTPWLRVGDCGGATGVLNLSGGSMIVRYKINLGYARGMTGWDYKIDGASSGYGEVNMSGGYLQTDSSNEVWLGATNTGITTNIIDPNTGNPMTLKAAGKGVFNLSGGVVVAGKVKVGKDYVPVDPLNLTGPQRPVVGILNITGGSFAAADYLEVGSEGGDGTLNVLGGTLNCPKGLRVGVIASTGWPYPTGAAVMHVGIGAKVDVGAAITDPNAYGFRLYDPNGSQTPAKLIVDSSKDGIGVINVLNGRAHLGSASQTVLQVDSLDQWRPDKYGDTFGVIIKNTGAMSNGGNFGSITTNLSRGADPNDPNLFVGTWDPNTKEYVLKFYGFNAGDANKDWSVGLIDLGRVSLNYGQSGKSWEDGDFTGEGSVGLTDLGKLSLYYGWTKPAGAPVPEPATMALLALGGAALIRRRRR